MSKKLFFYYVYCFFSGFCWRWICEFALSLCQELTVAPVEITGDSVTLAGSVDIRFKNHKAWEEFGYKDGNFQYFNQYWEDKEGQTFSYNGICFRLVSIEWTLVEHHKSYDHLKFTIELQLT